MKKTTFRISIITIFLLFISQIGFAQLSNFTFNVTATNETCLGNGSLTFNVTNTVPGASMDYSVYLLPNTTTPLIVVTSNTLTGLNGGNYLIIATQSLNGSSATKQQNSTILSSIQTISYSVSSTKVRCGNDGVLNVNVTSGFPSTYQLISGPVTTAPQSGNIFTGLSAGVYQIRVVDICGDASVQTYTLEQIPISLVIDNVSFPFAELPSCNTIVVSNFIGALTGVQIANPLTIQHTVFPPSGAPIIINSTLTAGNDFAIQTIPFFHNQSYYFNLKVTDACGNVYNKNNNVVNRKLELQAGILRFNCTDVGLKLVPNNYVSPYNITFNSFPAGFNPVTFNANHPGPFYSDFVVYGAVGNSMPVGTYNITINDSCGRSATTSFVIVPPNYTPVASGSNNGCGQIRVTILTIQMVDVVITSAPGGFPFPLPYNITSYLNADANVLTITGLPVGTYTIQVTDSCGVVHTLYPSILPYNPPPLIVVQRPGCAVGMGSVIVSSSVDIIASATLTAAPAAYTGTVPMNFNSNVDNGSLLFGNAPQGNYTFFITSTCGATRTSVVAVTGYQVTGNTLNVTENCGSFNLMLQHTSNGVYLQSYWLQKQDPISGNWGHPGTGVVYTSGTEPNTGNSLFIQNNINNLNLAYSGQFRIVKRFSTLGADGNYTSCIEVINSFIFNGGPKITSVDAILCASSNNEVVIHATGLPPLNYRIITKNGAPFIVNNGTSNSFSNLQPAIYKFEVSDVCTNVVNTEYDVTTLAPVSIQATTLCTGQTGSLSVTSFSFLTYEWWKGNNTTNILSTSSVLNFNPFNSVTDAGVYHVRISNPSAPTSCINTVLNYTISPNTVIPNAGLDNNVSYCGTQGVLDLSTLLNGTFDIGGTWQESTSSGMLTNNLWNSTSVNPGTYTFTYTVSTLCSGSDASTITITIKPIPQVPMASVDAISCETQDLNLYATTVNSATYQWNGPNGFTSTEQNPVITNASTSNNGVYTVKSIQNGCESSESSVVVAINPLPNFTLDEYCEGNVYSLTATIDNSLSPLPDYTYSWTGPENYSNNQNPIIITGLPTGTYSLTVTDNLGCSVTKDIPVLQTLCSIPKGVSANGDGSNDTFDLAGFDIDNLKIFNRYGMVVYKKDRYEDEWHGQDYNGNLLPTATYYYQVTLTSGKIETGWVYLQRI